MSKRTANTELLAALARVLSRRRLRWYLFGAEAVVIWGRPRMTADVDVTVEVEEAKLPGLVGALLKAGFRSRVDDCLAFAKQSRVVPLVHHKTRLPLDLVLSGPGLEERFFSRVRRVAVGGVRIPVIAPEDLVVLKLLAQRPQDLEDVRGIFMRRSAELDLDGVQALLREIEGALDRNDLLPLFQRLLSG